GQHEARDIAAAIDRARNAERFVGMNNGDMRRTEEVEILQRLPGGTRLVTSDYAERVVELEAAFAATLEINAAIFARERKVSAIWFAAGGRAIDRIAELLGGRARGNRQLPRLAVAPRCGLLRGRQDAFDGQARHRLGPECAAGKSFAQQFFQHVDA